MTRRKRRYYDSYECVKSYQQVAGEGNQTVHDWTLDEFFLNEKRRVVNKRKRSRIGHVETRGSK